MVIRISKRGFRPAAAKAKKLGDSNMTPVITLDSLRVQPNNPEWKGEYASRKIIFGEFSRYAIYAIHTRFDRVQFLVADAEVMDGVTNRPSVIRQSDTLEQALHGLDLAK